MVRRKSRFDKTEVTGQEQAEAPAEDRAEEPKLPEAEEVSYGVGGRYVSIGGGRRVRATAS